MIRVTIDLEPEEVFPGASDDPEDLPFIYQSLYDIIRSGMWTARLLIMDTLVEIKDREKTEIEDAFIKCQERDIRVIELISERMKVGILKDV
jgi:hypothetical protein